MAGVERYVIEGILLEGASPSALARNHHFSRSWIYELRERFKRGGYEALEPRSRHPLAAFNARKPSPHQPSHPPTTAFAATKSMPSARSPFVTWAGFVTS